MTKKEIVFAATRMHPELVYNMTKLEGNPYTFAEVKTLLDGITVGGRRLSDQAQVLRVSTAWEELRNQVAESRFHVSKTNFIHFNRIVAEGEALEVGDFRNGQVYIAGAKYTPPAATALDELFNTMLSDFNRSQDNILEKAFKLFLTAARYQFFWDGNKRTAQLMMNGVLMSAGLPPVSIPASHKRSYDKKMIKFYDNGDTAEMVAFLLKFANAERFKL